MDNALTSTATPEQSDVDLIFVLIDPGRQIDIVMLSSNARTRRQPNLVCATQVDETQHQCLHSLFEAIVSRISSAIQPYCHVDDAGAARSRAHTALRLHIHIVQCPGFQHTWFEQTARERMETTGLFAGTILLVTYGYRQPRSSVSATLSQEFRRVFGRELKFKATVPPHTCVSPRITFENSEDDSYVHALRLCGVQ